MPDMYDDEKTPGYMRLSSIQACAVDDVQMTDALLAVLVALGSYASQRNRDWLWASQETVARRMGKTRQYIGQATRQLADLGYVEIKAHYRDDGGRSTNWVRLRLDFQLPDERRRELYPRKKLGRGGRPRALPISIEDATPETPVVSYPPETPVVSPPETPVVSPPETLEVSGPETQWSFTKKLEEESRKRSGKKKNARATRDDDPSTPQKTEGEPEREDGAPDTTPFSPPPPPPPAWLWSRIYSRFRESGISSGQVASWITPCHLASYERRDGDLYLQIVAPSSSQKDMLERKYEHLIQQYAGSVMSLPGSRVHVDVSVAVARSAPMTSVPSEQPTAVVAAG